MASLCRIFSPAVLLLLSVCALGAAPISSALPPSSNAGWTLPLAFERNEGQMPATIGFLGRTPQYTVAIGRDGLRFQLPGAGGAMPVTLEFEGGHADAPVGLIEAAFRTNSYLGRDASRYRSGVRNYSRVGLRQVYPGVDVEFYAAGERMEHDFLVAPGANAGAIALTLRSGRAAILNGAGQITIAGETGELRLERPSAYQTTADGAHIEVASAFVLEERADGAQRVRFRLGAYDHTRQLVIDPVIVYATFAAGAGGSTATAIATDPAGNVYVAGTTTSAAFNPAPATAPVVNCGTNPCASNVFVAELAAGGDGASLQWITYIGAVSGSSTTTVAAMVANASTVYLGGSTDDTGLAAGSAASAPNATGGYVGYVSSLAATTGALNTTALLYLDATATNSAVRALALDGANNLYAAGALGSTTAPAAQLLTPSTHALAITPAVTAYTATAQPQPGNAFVAEFTAGAALNASTTYLATPAFFTYVQTNTQINGIGVDGAGAIYVGGQTTGGFSLTEGAGPATNGNGLNDAFELTFMPHSAAAPTIGSFTWIDGSGSDTVAGLALAGGGTSYLFGNTTSTNLPATTGVVQATPADTVGNGFVALAGSTGTSGVAPVALTYLGGSGTVDTITGGAFGNGNVYVTGQTNAPPATTVSPAATALAGVGTTVASATAPFNAHALAYGMDASGGTGTRGYLASLTANLSAVNYVANLGGAGGSDVATAVALDASHNAYVAGTIGHVSTPYTSLAAYQAVSPSTANPSAYVAEVAYAPVATGLTLVAASGSPSVNPVGYAGAGNASSVTYTWTLTAPTASGAANLVVQIPSVAQLTYTAASITDPGTANPPIACTIGTAGASCVIPTVPRTGGVNDALQVVLQATVPASAATMYGTFHVAATASSPASEYATSSQANTLAAPAVLTVTPATSFPAATVFSTNSGASGPQTRVTYAFTVANTGSGASAATIFTLTLPANLQVLAPVSVTSTGVVGTPTCDISSAATGCSAIDLPAGASLVYTLTGTYLDAAVGATGTSAAAPNFSATATGFLSTVNASIAPNTTVERGVHLHVVGTVNAPLAGQTNFNLTDSVTYTIHVSNAGPSASSGTDPLTVTLPAGFVPTAGSGGTALSCTAPYTMCTVPVPVVAAGGSTTFTVTGTFPDTALNQGVGASAQTRNFSAAIALPLVNAFESGGAASDYSSATAIQVQRTAVLSITKTLTPRGTVCTGGSAACVYMGNASDTGDKVGYSFAVQNAGPNVAVNASVTIALPFVPANPAGTAHPLVPGTPVETIGTPPFGTALTCTYVAGTNQIVCNSGNLPVAATALAVSGNATIGAGTTPATDAVPASNAFVTTASSPGSITATEDANGAPGAAALPVVEVDRAAHLVTAKQVVPSGTTPALPVNLDENAPALPSGVNDTLTVTVQVGNTPLNNAPNVIVTETLPAFFRVTQPPPAFCTTGTPALPLAANTLTGAAATPIVLHCALGTVNAGNATAGNGGAASVGTGAVSFSYAGKFEDNGTSADITGTLLAKSKQVAALVPSVSSVTPDAVDPNPASDATSATQTIGVVRAAHLVLRKTRNPTVAAAPSTFADRADPNLDEKTTATAFGLNDEVEYDIAIGNAGVNTALGVQFTETLPPYFTLVKTFLVSGASTQPDTGPNAAPGGQQPIANLVCSAGAAIGTPLVLPYATGPSSTQQITCTYGSPSSSPLALGKGASRSGAPDPATSIEFVYQGKFQDNAPADDTILAGASGATINSLAGDAFGSFSLAVDSGPTADGRSLPVPAYGIQRAAHLSVVGGSPFQLKPDDTPLTPGGLNGTAMIAEAEPSSAGAPTPTFNCLRYKVLVQNSGPNIARQPQLTLASPAALKLSSVVSGASTTASSDAALPSTCAYATSVGPTVTGATIVPTSERAGNTLVLDVDGFFGLNTLTGVNQQNGFSMRYTALADAGIKDSGASPAFAPITGSDVTVVNTPAGANFYVSPFTNMPVQPARMEFHAVAAPGVTTASVASSGPAPPSGVSPDPRFNQGSSTLYQAGKAPHFYTLATSAIPAAGSTTGVCLTSGTPGAPLADTFSKPERVLLWSLAGLPAGSPVNAVPHVTAPYAGDITVSVANAAGGAYVEAGGPAMPYTRGIPLPPRQTQPSQVCGQVNGFAPAAAPMTVAVLEPVNYAPLITGNPQAPAQAPGKGVSEVSFEFPTTFHDYNDNDPCYVGGVGNRASCDDNLALTTWVFGGENLLPAIGHAYGPLSPDLASSFLTVPNINPPAARVPHPYEVQAGATLFLEVADQVGELAFNAAGDCDPGGGPGYTPVNPCPVNSGTLSGTPPQKAIFGGAELATLTPSVNGGSSALIALPPAADATSGTTGLQAGYSMATATITAGQTVGFQWPLGSLVPATGAGYTLSCFLVDSATLATKIPFPAGMSCQIPADIVYPAGHTAASVADPAIYIATAGTVNARNLPRNDGAPASSWLNVVGGLSACLAVPLLLFGRRNRRWLKPGVLWMLLLLGGAAGVSGCGAGFNHTAASTAAAAGTYSFRASATPVGGGATLTTAAFQVKVVAGN